MGLKWKLYIFITAYYYCHSWVLVLNMVKISPYDYKSNDDSHGAAYRNPSRLTTITHEPKYHMNNCHVMAGPPLEIHGDHL